MRRLAFLALLILLIVAACVYPPRMVMPPDGKPQVGRTNAPSPGNPPRPQPPQCSEVARFRCDATRCPGFKYDYVSVQCPGDPVRSYCQANGGCKAEAGK